jgi:hypothetical protein
VGLVLAIVATDARGGQPILVDGYTDDWGSAPIYVDPLGDDGATGVDFERLYVTDDDDWLFVRFGTDAEIDLEDGSLIELYLDTDANASTGAQVGGIGAELRWLFGTRTGTFYGNPPSSSVDWRDIRFRLGPSTRASEWEIAIGRDVLPDGVAPLFTGGEIHVLLRDGAFGDRIPESGEIASFTFSTDGPSAPGPIALERDDPSHLRIVTHNVLQDSPWGAGQSARYDRLYSAMDPDVICFQEIYAHTAGEARTLVESWLPSGAGEFWFAAQENDRVTVSRYSVVNRWEVGSNLAILLPTASDIGLDVLLINCHLPCCENDAGRQAQVDEIMAFIGDAITPGGDVDIPQGTGIVITGDMNFVGDPQQLITLVTGDIINEGSLGPDVVPDWDGTDLQDRVSIQTEVRMPYTFYKESSTFSPSRLDYMIYSDSVLGIGNHYVLFTSNMSSGQLATYGLFAGDSEIASDHLPIVFDLYDGSTVSVAAPGSPVGMRPRLALSPNPVASGGVVTVSLDTPLAGDVAVDVFDVGGRRVRALESGEARGDLVSTLRLEWDGRDGSGRPVATGVYYIRVRGTDASGEPVDARARLSVIG